MDAKEIEERCVEHDVPVATAYTAADISSDPHMAARGDLVTVDDPVAGPLKQQAPYPRLDGDPAPVPSGAPKLGEHNEEVLSRLGTSRQRPGWRAANSSSLSMMTRPDVSALGYVITSVPSIFSSAASSSST